MLISLVSPLIGLLWLSARTGAQEFGQCDYVQDLAPGEQRPIFNPNYPGPYFAGAACRWTARSDRPIHLKCDGISMPASDRCSGDAITVYDGPNSRGHRYCGRGGIDIVTKSHQLTLTLLVSGYSQGGVFYCTVEAVEEDASPGIPQGGDACACGWRNPSRIVDGEETGINEFPMMAGLIDVDLKLLYCGATIINKKQVLTAAHCTYGRDLRRVGVLIGDHDLAAKYETNATQLYPVASAVTHPQYTNADSMFDVSIITIDGTMRFSQAVGPVCLPFQKAHRDFSRNNVEVLGWGSGGFGDGPSNTLQKVRQVVISNEDCSRSHAQVSRREICTYLEGKDSCQFDSGGPVIWQNPNSRRIVQIGIISTGLGCATDVPAVNTRVGPFIDWILDHTFPGVRYCTAE